MKAPSGLARASLVVWLALPLAACSSDGAKPRYYGTDASAVNATVKAIDHPTRTVTLKDDTGDVSTFSVDPRVKNLERVKVGDRVRAGYFESVSIEVRDPNGPGGTSGSTLADTSDWQEDGAFGRQTKVVAVVERLDRKKGTVALRGPAGNVHGFRVRDPRNLQNVKVGDEVVATYREALAVSIDPVSR